MLTQFTRLGDAPQEANPRVQPAAGRRSHGPRHSFSGAPWEDPRPRSTAKSVLYAARAGGSVKPVLREASMNDCDPVSPYLNRPIRSVEEVQRDLLANGNLKRIILRAITESRAQGRKPTHQFQDAVDALLMARPDIEESLAVKAVHRTMSQEKITSARHTKR